MNKCSMLFCCNGFLVIGFFSELGFLYIVYIGYDNKDYVDFFVFRYIIIKCVVLRK